MNQPERASIGERENDGDRVVAQAMYRAWGNYLSIPGLTRSERTTPNWHAFLPLLAAEGCSFDRSLQDRVGAWHRLRFPDAQMEHVALKGAEEMGEVASAVIGLAGVNSATGGGSVVDEAADVVICMMVLLDRWFGTDLLSAVETKLNVLTDPSSKHPASLPPAEERVTDLMKALEDSVNDAKAARQSGRGGES